MKNCMKYSSEKHNKTGTLTAIYTVGVLFLLFSCLLGLMLGSTWLSLRELFDSTGRFLSESAAGRIFLYVRVPRTVASVLCGAALAVSGAVTQCVLSNRLASPSVIGVNAGAALAVTVCTSLGIYGGWRMSLFSFLGAFITVLLLSLTARGFGTRSSTLILVGVAVNSLLGAVSDSIVVFNEDVAAMTRDFRVGDFSSVSYGKLCPVIMPILLSVLLLFVLSRELDVLTLGDETARSLGMNVQGTKILLLMLCAMLAGCAVSCAGLLSFVGLIVPHAVRRVVVAGHRHLIPLCALYGGGFVCLCDTLARSVFAPFEIPVGIIMAFLGAPFFVFILLRGKGGESGHA